MEWRRGSPGVQAAATAAAVAAMVVLLGLMGRDAICPCGRVDLWHGAVPSPEGSQHLLDWWTFSHVIHGFLFYAALWLAVPWLHVGWRFLAAAVGEIGWEILENSDWVIERYRTVTAAIDYNGDSIVNSLVDVGAMGLGFLLARVLPVWLSVAIVIAIEALPMLVIRDGLIMNVLTLVLPMPGIVEWQAGA